jgi:hypothetical protein
MLIEVIQELHCFIGTISMPIMCFNQLQSHSPTEIGSIIYARASLFWAPSSQDYYPFNTLNY